MKKTYWLKIAVLGIPYFFNFSTVLGQDFKGMNKEELRTNLTQSLREVDSLILVVDGLRRDLTNKTNQIAIGLREQSSLKDVNNKLKSDLEAKALELNLYKSKFDSLSKITNIKSDSLERVLNELNQNRESIKATCTQKYLSENGNDPVIEETCSYGKFKTVTTGYPDYRGIYSYDYALLAKQGNGLYVKISNSSMFNHRRDELLSEVNNKIQDDFKHYLSFPEASYCFDGFKLEYFDFDQLKISFKDSKINFHITFGLEGSCRSIDGTIVTMWIYEIQKYLAE